MKKNNLPFLVIALLAITATNDVLAQGHRMEMLGIPGPLYFDGWNYNFLRATKPNDITYYQEYITDNETTDNYNQMLICKLFLTDASVQDVAEHKMRQIEQLKKTDSVSTVRIFKSSSGKEFIVDYFLGEYTKENKLTTVDYWIYRYKRIKLENDSVAVLAFVYNRHSNGKNPERFLKKLNRQKDDYIEKMRSAELPTIKLQPKMIFYAKDPIKEKAYTGELTETQEKAKSDFLEGTKLNNSRQYLQAIERFKKAIEIDSTGNCSTRMNGAAFGELGDCYFNLGDYTNALICFDKGIQINKYYPLTYLHKANLFSIQHQKDEAIKTLDELINNNSNEPMAYFQRAILYDSTKAELASADIKTCLKLIKEQNREEPLKEMVKYLQQKSRDIEKRLDKK